ncbi:DUF6318 family protein [Cellulomonas edaphi]|uniref:DUF6318 family protein n=1 Tax=Cellulomonas edaphi TaxID=3053468 RepID=A0ABT7S8L0_9CELL|nr:DUF6318 family protein [Cellulomons edaphi]MDM7831274.1 DUF6318 family protein [Cellulomons edaphi]
MLRDVRILLTALVLAGTLAACSPDDAPVAQPTGSPSQVSAAPTVTPVPSASAMPSVEPVADVTVAPERPAALDEKPSRTGSVAVGSYFMQLFPYASATGDLDLWNSLSDEACEFCASTRAGVKANGDAGLHDVGGALRVLRSASREVVKDQTYSVRLDVEQSASRSVDAGGVTVKSYPGPKSLRVTLVINWDGGWLIRGVQVDPLKS